MRKILLLSFAISFFFVSSYGQSIEQDLLPDTLGVSESREFVTDGNIIHAITKKDYQTYYYIKLENGNLEFIDDVPYTLGNSRTVGMEMFDGDVYHLTSGKGVRIYKQNGTWASITADDGLHSGCVYGLFKDNDKLYIITEDTLNYFDGSTWRYYAFSSGDDYVKIQKYSNRIYFFGELGLYSLDGSIMDTLISERYIYSFSIFEGKMYVSFSSNLKEVTIYNMDGSLSSVDLNYPISEQSSACVVNDTLCFLSSSQEESFCIKIESGAIKQIQHYENKTYDYKKIGSYKKGIVVSNDDNRLVYINMSKYDDFGSLQLGKTYKNLDINQVDAYYMHRGRMFWDGVGSAEYEVPKGSGKHSIFAGGLWLSAQDASDNAHAAVAKFRSRDCNFYPGPLRATGSLKGTTDTAYARNFDYIWRITREEILLHQINYTKPDYTVPHDIASWPAHGNVSDGYAKDLAPFIDVDGNGIYEPNKGDYPDIKGDMALYWIFNDHLAKHTESLKTVPLGAEVHMQAYAYTCNTLEGADTILNYTTFINYKVINRSDTAYHNFTSAFWTDADLGYAWDDYVGTHVGLNSMYFYNGNDMDGTGNGIEYGENPPAQFISVLDAPLATENDGIDNDNDGTIDEEGEKALLNGMMYFNNDASNQGDPIYGGQFYNYMHNMWKDNRHLIFGGTGYASSGGTPAKYMFPGESDPWMNGTDGVDPEYDAEGGWTEENEGNAPADRRGVMNSGPFDFNPGDELEFTLAFVWSRGNDGPMSSVNKGFDDVARIIEMYNSGELHGCGLEDVSVKEVNPTNSIEIFPNPAQDKIIVKGVQDNTKYQIINIKGQTVQEGLCTKEKISIKELSKGTYIVKLISKDTVKTEKLIVE